MEIQQAEQAGQFLKAQSRFISAEIEALLSDKVVLMENWKWMVIAFALFAGFTFRPLLQYVIHKLKKTKSLTKDSHVFFIKFLNENIEKSLSWIFTGLIWLAIVDSTQPHPTVLKYLKILIQVVLSVNFIRLAYLAVDALGEVFLVLASKTENTIDDQLAPFATKSLKVIVVTLGILIVLQNFGVDVTALLAGVGIAGMAIAFAAKDTVENVFGSLTIIFDRPFKVGDHIKIGEVEGIIEDVGFRSTRIRTFYNSLISIPNANMAREKIDNYQLRQKRRVRFNIGLDYKTSRSSIELFRQSIENHLKDLPKVDSSSVLVRFTTFGEYSLNLLIVYHLLTSDGPEEFKFQEEINLTIMKLAEEQRINFAYPTQMVYINKEP